MARRCFGTKWYDDDARSTRDGDTGNEDNSSLAQFFNLDNSSLLGFLNLTNMPCSVLP